MPQPVPGPVSNENTAPSTSDEIKTVFHDVNNFNVKHPLLNAWSLWVSAATPFFLFLLTMFSSPSRRPQKETIGTTC